MPVASGALHRVQEARVHAWPVMPSSQVHGQPRWVGWVRLACQARGSSTRPAQLGVLGLSGNEVWQRPGVLGAPGLSGEEVQPWAESPRGKGCPRCLTQQLQPGMMVGPAGNYQAITPACAHV